MVVYIIERLSEPCAGVYNGPPAVYRVWHQTAGPQRGTRRAVQGLSHSHLTPMYMYMCAVDSGHPERGSGRSICLGSVKINWLCWAGATSARKLDQRGTCLTALLPGETVGNTAPIPGQANVTDTLGHLGVPGSRHPYWDCWYGHPRSRRTHLHATPNMTNGSHAYT